MATMFARTCRALPTGTALHRALNGAALPRAPGALGLAGPGPAWSSVARFAARASAVKAVKVAKPKDPERPKLPPSGYLRFATEYRGQQALKDEKAPMQVIGSAWKGLSALEKAPYEEAAKKDRDVYKEAFASYKDSGKLDAFKRDPKMPKRPLAPFLEWTTAERKAPRFANVKMTEVTKLLKKDWDVIPQLRKNELNATFASKMEAYKKALAEYKASGAEKEWLAQTGRLALIEKAEAKKAKLEAQEREKKEKAKLAKEKLKAKEAVAKEKAKLAREKLVAKKKAAQLKLKAQEEEKKAKAKAAQEKLKAKEAEKKAKAALQAKSGIIKLATRRSQATAATAA